MISWYRRYLLPGLVFQSIIIAGGYGTGRELVEFFLRFGPLGGLLGMLLPATVVVSLTCMLGFELARVTRCYDYRSFLRQLLGRAWFLFEIGYLTAVLLILAVIGSAAGTFLAETFGLPYAVGVASLLVAVGFLVFKGSRAIEAFFSLWSFVLYATYITFFVWSLVRFGGADLGAAEIGEGWAFSGIRYGALQVSLIPAMLFATTDIRRRREAVVAGLLSGPIAIVPGVLFFLAMVPHYPAVLERPVPANYLLELLGSRPFQITFQIVLFGTLIETGTGLIHAVNERLARTYEDRGRTMPTAVRPAIAVAFLCAGALLTRFGLISLIAAGYGAMSWIFLAIFVVPLVTVGALKIRRAPSVS